METKVLVGVSGGPDSMYLLNDLYHTDGIVPVALHVNYHLRDESDIDESIVVNFCIKNNIEFKVLNVTKDIWDKSSFLKNKQAIAREIRYVFYLKESKLMDINEIYIGHHKDDFIETAIMQNSRSDKLLFYGIKESSNYKELIIKRPLLNKYKVDIIKELNKFGIDFVIDKTNADLIYERNIIRNDLSIKTLEEKELIFKSFDKINIKNKELVEKINMSYFNWSENNFDWGVFNKIDEDQKRHVIFQYLTRQNIRINISSDKLDSIVEFLKTKKGDKFYRLMENTFITTKNSRILIQTK